MRGPLGTELRVTIQRTGVDRPLELNVARAVIPVPGVELRVRLETGKLMIESTGLGQSSTRGRKPIALAAKSEHGFYVADGDNTRIAFVRDAGGRCRERSQSRAVAAKWE